MKEKMEDPKNQDVLLVTEKDGTKLKAVTGINEDGTPKTVKPESKHEPEFLKIDKHGNALENFMSNFMRQCKEPTHFQFFKVPFEQLDKLVTVLQEMLKNPEAPANKEMLDTHRVLPEAFAKKEYQAVDESRIDWKQFEQLGVTKEMIEQTNSMDKLLNWQKTPVLLPIKADIGETAIRTDARLSLRETPEGKLNLVVHAVRKDPQIEGLTYGARLTEDDKQNLRQTGNAGRLVEIEPIKDQKMMAFLSIDKLTNELVAVRADRIKIPNEIKGVTLDDAQKKDLSEGRAVYIENMTSKNGKPFDATVQMNADRRGLEFNFDTANKLEKAQTLNGEPQKFHIPTKLMGAELSQEQQDKIREDKAVYVAGMTDRKGEPFNAYVKINHEKGKFDFFKWNPDKAQKQGAEVTPDNVSKTQVAVNSEGKTNEATKKVKEPIKKGQTQPTEKQQESSDRQSQKQEKKEVQKQKPKGMRM